MTDPERIAGQLTEADRLAFRKGRLRYIECPYSHPTGTRCPSCSSWPYEKGGAVEFTAAVKAILENRNAD